MKLGKPHNVISTQNRTPTDQDLNNAFSHFFRQVKHHI